MKSCPSCQQVYTDEGPDFCLNDGTPLVRTPSAYNPGASSGNQWQPPAQGWQSPPQPGMGYPPPPYSPYGYGPQSSGTGAGIAKAALFTGIGSLATLAVVFLIAATSTRTRDEQALAGIIFLLSLITGLAAVILGIVSLSMSSKYPAVGKAKGIIGLILGLIPIILFFISLVAATGRFR